MSAVVVSDLVKVYGGRRAVDGVSFTIAPGEVYGLLGENGAGKSTTVEILEGHRSPTAGTVRVLGDDPQRAGRDFRDRIGVVLQSSEVERQLTVREAVALYRRSYRRRRPIDESIEIVGLVDAADQRVGTLSGGQKRRLDLALGIVGYPELLFLDEPTTGFDPAARRSSWELIRTLGSEGVTVLLTSHYLDEVEYLADRVGVLARGRFVAEGTPAMLAAASGSTTIRFQLPPAVDAVELAGVAGAGLHSGPGGLVTIASDAPTLTLHRITGWAIERGVELSGLSVTRPTLEDMFLSIAHEDTA